MSKNEKQVRKPDFVNSFTHEEVSTYPMYDFKKTVIKDLKEKQEKFLGKCPICGEQLKYSGGNILTCANMKCKGTPKKVIIEKEDKTVYSPYFKLLTSSYGCYGERLFS